MSGYFPIVILFRVSLYGNLVPDAPELRGFSNNGDGRLGPKVITGSPPSLFKVKEFPYDCLVRLKYKQPLFVVCHFLFSAFSFILTFAYRPCFVTILLSLTLQFISRDEAPAISLHGLKKIKFSLTFFYL